MIKSARDKVTVGGGVKPSFSVDIFDVSSLLELPKFREQLLSFLETPLFKSVHPLKLFFLVQARSPSIWSITSRLQNHIDEVIIKIGRYDHTPVFVTKMLTVFGA